MQVDFDSLGSYLRQERERQQIPLQDIAAATKIQLKFLEALERDAYDQLPAEPFVLGFLRAYAQHVALDPAAVLAAYRSLHRLTTPTAEFPAKPTPVAAPAFEPRPLRRLGIFVALGGLLVGAVLYEVRRGQQTRGTVTSFPAGLPVPGATPLESTPAPAAAPLLPRSEPTRIVPPVPPQPPVPSLAAELRPAVPALSTVDAAPPPAAAVPAPPKPLGSSEATRTLVLEATAVSDTWLGIEVDGGKRQNMLLTAGKSAQWEAQERFRITVGNARGTRLALNGQEITLQGGRSNVVRELVLSRAQLP